MTESDLWKTISNARAFANVHMTRIENSAMVGISDVSAAYLGVEVWLELKVFKSGRLHFRTSQRDWIRKRIAAGGRVVVLARSMDTVTLWNPLDLLNLPVKIEVQGKSFSVKPEYEPTEKGLLFRTVKQFDWGGVRKTLFFR